MEESATHPVWLEPVVAPDRVSSKTCDASDWHAGEEEGWRTQGAEVD